MHRFPQFEESVSIEDCENLHSVLSQDAKELASAVNEYLSDKGNLKDLAEYKGQEAQYVLDLLDAVSVYSYRPSHKSHIDAYSS